MKKLATSIALATVLGGTAFAGGFLTNTNQSVSFLRQPAQNAVIGVNGAHYNPAGVGFLPDGWQVSFNVQNAHQTRTIESSFAPFAYNTGDGITKKYKGKAYAPVIPSLDLTYVHGKLFGSFHFGVVGGGGKATFDDGLGSLESAVAMLPAVINQVAGAPVLTGYDADLSMIGQQYIFSGQLNFGYRINEHLSVAVGARLVYSSNRYEALIGNLRLRPTGGDFAPAGTVLGAVLGGLGIPAQYAAAASALVEDKELNASQKGLGILPVVSVDYKTGRFNFAARYEFNASIDVKNSTKVNTTGLPQYEDGLKLANDMPALLALGAEWSALDNLRLSLGYHNYFDRQSKVYNPLTGLDDKTKLIDRNPFEFLAGVEWDVSAPLTLSCGGQITRFGYGDDKAYISDQSFNPSSFSLGAGLQYRFSDKLSVDAAIFNTFYSHMTKDMADYNNAGASMAARLAPLAAAVPALAGASFAVPGSDRYHRTSLVLGLGVNYKF